MIKPNKGTIIARIRDLAMSHPRLLTKEKITTAIVAHPRLMTYSLGLVLALTIAALISSSSGQEADAFLTRMYVKPIEGWKR